MRKHIWSTLDTKFKSGVATHQPRNGSKNDSLHIRDYNAIYNILISNTILVFEILFPTARKIWYSIDLNNIIHFDSYWITFNLKDTKILSKSALDQFKKLIVSKQLYKIIKFIKILQLNNLEDKTNQVNY